MSEDSKSSPENSQQTSRSGAESGEQQEVNSRNSSATASQSDSGGPGAQSAASDDPGEAADKDRDGTLQRLEEAENLVRKHQDDMLRLQAEMQNLRRRTELDVEKAHKYGQERLVTELVGVIDNLERTLEAASAGDDEQTASAQSDEKLKAIREGVELTLKSFLDCFRKFSVEPIDPLGEPFDPQRHEAMATVANDQVEPNTVTAVMQKGYLLHGRVVRPAMVMVSK